MSEYEIKKLQETLNGLGINSGPEDGIWGRRTAAAVRAFQRINGLRADAIVGPRTKAALYPGPIPGRDDGVAVQSPAQSIVWPRQRDVSSFYGKVGTNQKLITLPYKMKLAWDLRRTVSRMSCHKQVAEPMTAIFENTLQHYGKDGVSDMGLDLFGGCLNVRKMRGGTNWSMHSWGIAVDLDPLKNQLRWGKDKASFAKPEYEPFWEIVEAQGAVSLGRIKNYDWMHLQFARL